nr:hypothetical protein [Nostoc sp. ChiSLP03a]
MVFQDAINRVSTSVLTQGIIAAYELLAHIMLRSPYLQQFV